MKKNWIYLVTFLLGIWIGYRGFLKFYANILYAGAKKKIGAADNEFRFAEIPDENSRFVVKPNPDFLYSTCFYNLDDGPLRMTGDLPDSSYWSISFYEPNTVNFYVKNDLQFHSNEMDMIIAREGDKLPTNKEDFEIVKAPSNKGLILFRLLVTDNSDENVEKYKTIQKSVKIDKLMVND